MTKKNEPPVLQVPNRKAIRSSIVAEYVREGGFRGAVIFSCGNASESLKATGIDVLDVAPNGVLRPSAKWWTPGEVARIFAGWFDATSGHLPAHLMVKLAAALRADLGPLDQDTYVVPTGSGETIVALRWAYPEKTFHPMYNVSEGTRLCKDAPLNWVVQR